MVSITGGSPSLARSRLMVAFTVVVNGLVASSHTRCEQFLGRDRPSLGGEQALQHGEFLVGQRQRPPAPGGGAPGGVQAQVAVAQDRGRRGAGAAGQGLDAGDQLGEVERLGQVVVGPEAEPLHPVLDRPGRGEHQDPARRPLGGQGAADVIAVHAGQVPVQHHHVIAADRQPVEGGVAIEGHVDRHPVAAQARRDRLGQPFVIFG